MGRVLHCCSNENWQARLAGAAALRLLMAHPQLPPAYLSHWAAHTTRALLWVVRGLPDHCVAEAAQLDTSLATLLRKALLGEQPAPGGVQGQQTDGLADGEKQQNAEKGGEKKSSNEASGGGEAGKKGDAQQADAGKEEREGAGRAKQAEPAAMEVGLDGAPFFMYAAAWFAKLDEAAEAASCCCCCGVRMLNSACPGMLIQRSRTGMRTHRALPMIRCVRLNKKRVIQKHPGCSPWDVPTSSTLDEHDAHDPAMGVGP
eukprot:1158893-Pelagomonas_calceolata.AAC.3